MPADLPTLLPPNSSAHERAVEQTLAARFAALDPAAIKLAKDPWTCPEEFLDFLAFEYSVDLWDDEWPVWKKRSVIASALADHSLKGTEAGARRYLEIADAELVQVITPPQGFYASPDLSKAEWDALIAKHPKVRISLSSSLGSYEAPGGVFADNTFVNHACLTLDEGRALHGRKAWLVRGEEREPLQLVTIERTEDTRAALVLERVVIPGKTAHSLIADASFLGDAYADATDKAPAYYTFSLSRSYLHEDSQLALTTVPIGYEPRDTRFVRESDQGSRDQAFFVGDTLGVGFVEIDNGGDLLADVLYLHDPAVAVPQVAGMSFVDHSRIGMRHHTAEMLVDWKTGMRPGSAFIADGSFVGHDPVCAEDTSRRDFCLTALARSSRATDRIRVTFQTRRERTLGDGLRLDGSTALGASVPNQL